MKKHLLLLLFIVFSGLLYPQVNDTLIIGVKQAPPFLMEEDGEWTGASVELWNQIARELKLNYEYREYNLKDLVSALAQGEIDMSINPLTVTAERIESFDFTQPFYISNLTVASKAGNSSFFSSFIGNFFSADFFKALFGLILLIFIFGFIIWLVEKKKNPEMFSKGWKGMGDGFWWSAVTMTTVGYGDKAPVTPVGRILGFVWMFTAIIVISGFTASIASSLTVNRLGNNIENVDDLRHVTVATVEGSSAAAYLDENGIDHITFPTLDKALDALDNDEFKALVYDDAILNYSVFMKNLQDEVSILPVKFNKQYYSFAIPYGKNITNSINKELVEVIETPFWREVLSRYKAELE